MTVFLAMLAATFSLGALIISLIGWTVHCGMTKDYGARNGWDYASWSTFRRYFDSLTWPDGNRGWTGSLFDYGTNSEVHAGMIKFYGKYMMLDYISWIRFYFFMRSKSPAPVKASGRRPGIWV